MLLLIQLEKEIGCPLATVILSESMFLHSNDPMTVPVASLTRVILEIDLEWTKLDVETT